MKREVTSAVQGITPASNHLAASRAVEAVIWGMPAVNFQLIYDQMVKAGGEFNQSSTQRYSVGTKNKGWKTSEDGSLTIYGKPIHRKAIDETTGYPRKKAATSRCMSAYIGRSPKRFTLEEESVL